MLGDQPDRRGAGQRCRHSHQTDGRSPSDHSEYPHQFDISMIDGRLPIEAVPDIVRRLGVTIVVPDNRNDDPYAGLRFDPDGTTRPFSLLVFDH